MLSKGVIEHTFSNIEPQITSHESGPEPSIDRLITEYYTSNGIGRSVAIELTTQYIRKWVLEFQSIERDYNAD